MEAVKLHFPGGNTCIHTPTVKLAGKPSLPDSIVVVSKDQMNYVPRMHRAELTLCCCCSQSSWEMKSKLP